MKGSKKFVRTLSLAWRAHMTAPTVRPWCCVRRTAPHAKLAHVFYELPLVVSPKDKGEQNTVALQIGYGFDSLDQRAANGGSDPSWLNLAFLGRPDFPSRGPRTL